MRKWFVVVSVLVLALVAGCVVTPGMSPLETPVAPGGGLDGGGDVDVPALPAFLEMLAGPTGWVILGALFSSLAAKWPWYNAQGDALKRGLILGVSIVMAIGARLTLTYMPAAFWEATAAYWYIIGGVVMTWLGSQAWFRAVVKPAALARKVKADLAETGL
jgi:hypothetical protein